MVYYNDSDKHVAQWLRNLTADGKLSKGRVDEHPIQEVRPSDLSGIRRAHFFSGIGGWELALQIAGWPQDRPVWTGSCPCQPFSQAGRRRGFADERHLWPIWRGLIAECRPATVFGEQVASKDGRLWLNRVRLDLEALGYAVGAADLCAAGIEAPHIRQRLYWVAFADGPGRKTCRQRPSQQDQRPKSSATHGGLGDAERLGQPGESRPRSGGKPADGRSNGGPWDQAVWLPCRDGKARRIEPGLSPLAHGVPGRVGRLRAYGNAIVPQLAAEFVRAAQEAILSLAER